VLPVGFDRTRRRAHRHHAPPAHHRTRRRARLARAARLGGGARLAAQPHLTPEDCLHVWSSRHPAAPRAARAAPRRRTGLALPTALLLLVVMTALAGGAFAMSRQSFRGGRNALVEARAFAAAEYGLNRQISEWNPAFNLPTSSGGCDGRQSFVSNVWPRGDRPRPVRITRLDPALFFVESLGARQRRQPAAAGDAQRRRARAPRLPVHHAAGRHHHERQPDHPGQRVHRGRARPCARLHHDGRAGGGELQRERRRLGSEPLHRADDLRGRPRDRRPAADAAQPEHDTIAPGSLGVLNTAIAGNPNTYIQFGTETMATLISGADKWYGPAALYADNVTPPDVDVSANEVRPDLRTDGSGTCNTGRLGNWGEPFGGTDDVVACQPYFPIIYVNGNANIQGNGRGQGILIVNGDLQINGNFDFVGLILVRDDFNKGNGTARITGAIMAGNRISDAFSTVAAARR
jgi:hypothetical protein